MAAGKPTARVIALDEIWTYVGAGREEKRQEVQTWPAVVVETDESR